MSLQINEIGIRMSVRDTEKSEEERAKKMSGRDGCGTLDYEAIVDDCVRRVLRIIQTLDAR